MCGRHSPEFSERRRRKHLHSSLPKRICIYNRYLEPGWTTFTASCAECNRKRHFGLTGTMYCSTAFRLPEFRMADNHRQDRVWNGLECFLGFGSLRDNQDRSGSGPALPVSHGAIEWNVETESIAVKMEHPLRPLRMRTADSGRQW